MVQAIFFLKRSGRCSHGHSFRGRRVAGKELHVARFFCARLARKYGSERRLTLAEAVEGGDDIVEGFEAVHAFGAAAIAGSPSTSIACRKFSTSIAAKSPSTACFSSAARKLPANSAAAPNACTASKPSTISSPPSTASASVSLRSLPYFLA